MILVGLLYFILSIIFSWPLALHFSTYTPGTVGDAYQFIWQAWWFKYALFQLHQNPIFTNYIFYPLGCSVGTIDLAWFPVSIAIMLQFVFNSIVTYNCIFLLTFVATGFSAYSLCYYFTKDGFASFVSSIIFAFSSQRMGFGLGFMPLLNVQFLPLYILYLFKLKETGNFKTFILALLFLWLISLCSWYYMALALIFTIFFLGYYLVRGEIKRKDIIRKITVLVGAFSVTILPFFLPAIRIFLTGGGKADSIQNADLAAFFIPFVSHPIFGKLSWKLFNNIQGCAADSTVFIGYTVLFFIIYAFLRVHDRNSKFWKSVLIFFFLLSLGPHLVFLGKNYKNFPLPFFFLKYTPFYTYLYRLPFVAVLISLPSAVLVAFSLKNLRFSKYITFMVLIFILFEFFSAPYPITFKEVPSFYKSLAKDSDKYAILELPLYECPSSQPKCQYYYCFYQYWQTFHHKPILGGYLARNTPERLIKFTEDTPFIRELKNPLSLSNSIDKEKAIEILKQNKIKYIILHRYFPYRNNKGSAFLYPDQINFEKEKKICDSFLKKILDTPEMLVYEAI